MVRVGTVGDVGADGRLEPGPGLGDALGDADDVVGDDCPDAARGVPATSLVHAATHAAAMTNPESTCATLRTVTALTYTPSGLFRRVCSNNELFDQRIDHHTQIAVVLLGHAPLALVGRAALRNFGDPRELVGAVQ